MTIFREEFGVQMKGPSDIEKYPWRYEKHEDWTKRVKALNQSLKQRSAVELKLLKKDPGDPIEGTSKLLSFRTDEA